LCVKTEQPCFFFFGIIAGIVTGGIVAGVVAAALILLGATAGSTAYAVSQFEVHSTEAVINNNPLYTKKMKVRDNPLG